MFRKSVQDSTVSLTSAEHCIGLKSPESSSSVLFSCGRKLLRKTAWPFRDVFGRSQKCRNRGLFANHFLSWSLAGIKW